MTAQPMPGKRKASRALRLSVFVQNQTGRSGVPQSRSFETWIRAALATRRGGWTEVNVVIVDEATGRVFNRDFRNKDYATNVLSFPYAAMPGEPGGLLGDLLFCAPVIAREAIAQHKSPRDHYAHLTVHGVLHLLGYDHLNDADAETMEALERRVLASLSIGDPY